MLQNEIIQAQDIHIQLRARIRKLEAEIAMLQKTIVQLTK